MVEEVGEGCHGGETGMVTIGMPNLGIRIRPISGQEALGLPSDTASTYSHIGAHETNIEGWGMQ